MAPKFWLVTVLLTGCSGCEPVRSPSAPLSASSRLELNEDFECALAIGEKKRASLEAIFQSALSSSPALLIGEGGGDCLEQKVFTLEKLSEKDGYALSLQNEKNLVFAHRELLPRQSATISGLLAELKVSDRDPRGCEREDLACESFLTVTLEGREKKYRPSHSSNGSSAEAFLSNPEFRRLLDYLSSLAETE